MLEGHHRQLPNERRRAIEEEQGCRRAEEFARRNDDEIVMARRVQVRGKHAKLRSTRGNICKEFVSQDCKAAINIRRCVVLTN